MSTHEGNGGFGWRCGGSARWWGFGGVLDCGVEADAFMRVGAVVGRHFIVGLEGLSLDLSRTNERLK